MWTINIRLFTIALLSALVLELSCTSFANVGSHRHHSTSWSWKLLFLSTTLVLYSVATSSALVLPSAGKIGELSLSSAKRCLAAPANTIHTHLLSNRFGNTHMPTPVSDAATTGLICHFGCRPVDGGWIISPETAPGQDILKAAYDIINCGDPQVRQVWTKTEAWSMFPAVYIWTSVGDSLFVRSFSRKWGSPRASRWHFRIVYYRKCGA